MQSKFNFSVGIEHPDKIADIIADKILEYLHQQDLWAQLDAEVLLTKDLVVVAGTWNSSVVKELEIDDVVRGELKELSWNWETISIKNLLEKKERANTYNIISVGYAANETENYLPRSFSFVRDINNRMQNCLQRNVLEGVKNNYEITAILDNNLVTFLSMYVEHEKNVSIENVKVSIHRKVILKSLERDGLFTNEPEKNIKTLDPNSRKNVGTSNKRLSLDSYGFDIEVAASGLCGKDLSHRERLGVYFARWIAKNVAASITCDNITIKLIHRVDIDKPHIVLEFKESDYGCISLGSCISATFDFTYDEVYKIFNQPNIKFSDLPKHGHFTNPNLPWESLDKVEDIKNYLYGN